MSVERSVWVVGDIHGMLDPLTVLLNTIRYVEYSRNRAKTIVFLGDYIDHGPCSREVVDSLLALREDFEVVFLAGNHEDMLLHFLNPVAGMEDYAQMWLQGNGGQATVCSFVRSRSLLKHLWMRSSTVQTVVPDDVVLDVRHREFFDSLVYAHTDDLGIDGGESGALSLAFSHAPLHRLEDLDAAARAQCRAIPLSQQLSVRTRYDFMAMCRRHPMWVERYQIWNRAMPRSRYGDFLLIHGHTPTPILDGQRSDRLGGFDPGSVLPFVVFPEGRVVDVTREGEDIRFDAPLSAVAAINIDTGCVYGGALTALNFSTNRLRTDARIGVVQVHPGWTQRDFGGCARFHLCFNGL